MALGVAVTTDRGAGGAGGIRERDRDALRCREDSRAVMVARAFEFAAALGVLAFGLALMFAGRMA